MNRQHRLSFALSALVLLGLSVFVALRFSVTTDITSLLPDEGDQDTISLVRQVADSELGRTMVLTVGAPDSAQTLAATRALEERLRADGEAMKRIASLEGGPKEGTEQAIYELYQPRRFAFAADGAAALEDLLSPAGLKRAAVDLRDELGRAMSPLIGRVAPADPLQILPHLFQRLEREQGGNLRIEDGRFLTRDGKYGVLFLRSKARGFDSTEQAPLLAAIDRAFVGVQAELGAAISLDQSGVNRFAVQAEGAISHDLEQVSILSTLGLALLMFALFRSLRLLAIASIPLGAGMIAGLAVCLALYGRVHGITLAFGASLLGVALDYVEHLYCHHAVAPHPDGPAATLRSIRPALLTGAVTTLIGFLALGGAGFRGLQEVALFSSTGLLAALVTTFSMLPAVLPRTVKPVPFRDRLVERLGRAFDGLQRHRRRLWILPAAAIVLCAVGLPRLHLSTDATLGQMDAQLLAEDERVRTRVARYEQMRFVLAIGDTEEKALQHNDALYRALQSARDAGEIGGFRNVGAFLPSAAQQHAVSAALHASLDDGSALVNTLAEAGFMADKFAPFRAALAAPEPAPLTFADLHESALTGFVSPFRITLKQGVAFLTFLERIQDPDAFAARIAALPGARFVDQQTQLSRGHALYQQRTAELVLWGVAGVFILLALRYRKLSLTLAAFLPSLLASGVTLSVQALAGRPLDLVGLSALLMVISMGVDYGVFLVDANHSDEERRIALLSVFLAASTTVLGFGLLALSRHPMLSVIGVTATVGMVACLVLAPTTLVLIGKKETA